MPTSRLHDARHAAATVLLVLGVSERTVMSVMGWSSTSMAARYQHVTDPIRRDVANRIGGLLWTGPTAATMPIEPIIEPIARSSPSSTGAAKAFPPCQRRGGCGIRTREGVNPTRFPSPHWSVRRRPSASVPA